MSDPTWGSEQRPPTGPGEAPPSWGQPPPGGWGPPPHPGGDPSNPWGPPPGTAPPAAGAGGVGPPPPGQYPGAPPGWRPPPPPPLQGGPLRPFTLGDVLDGMFRVVVANIRTILLALAFISIPVNLVLTYFQRDMFGGRGLFSLLSNPAEFEAAMASGSPFPVGSLLGVYGVAGVNAVIFAPLMAGLIVSIDRTWLLDGRKLSTGEAWRATIGRWPVLIATVLLNGLLILLPFIPGGILIALGFVFNENVALFVLGGILLFVALFAAIALGVMLMLTPVAVVAEGLGPVAGIRRSMALVRRRFWPFFGTMLLVGLIIQLVAGTLGTLMTLPGMLISGPVGYALLAAGTIFVELVSTPLYTTALTLEYVDLRIRTEGLDLELAMDRLGPRPDAAFKGAPAG